jgi:nicotinamide-nucleotide amidase
MLNNSIFELAETVGGQLKALGKKTTCVESCTGGGVAFALTSVAGSSQWFDGSYVTYADRTKRNWVGVMKSSLETEGAVSETVVEQMAKGSLISVGADFSVAISGIAGPDGGTVDKPVGTVWFAWASKRQVFTELCCLKGDRTVVREQAIVKALQGLQKLIAED